MSHRRHRVVTDSATAERYSYLVPPRLLSLLRGKTVHVDPFETAAIAAYGLRWRPLPVVQAYSAYTSTLDDHNAAFLGSPEAPQRVLRQNTDLQINDRSRELEAPAEFRALICNYEQLGSSKEWQVSGTFRNRCGAEHVLGIVYSVFRCGDSCSERGAERARLRAGASRRSTGEQIAQLALQAACASHLARRRARLRAARRGNGD